MSKEIWFEKFMWAYMPCHWKGWAFLAGVAAIVVPVLIVIEKISSRPGWESVDFLFIVVLVCAFIFTGIVARRHSK
ncbi:MAG: hypothetical protein JZU55_00990 [Afipia sp.]|nr:hypothetical protein [Afipia sp.]